MSAEWVNSLLIGESLVMRQLRMKILCAGTSDLPVLIEGPTGSGKELVAQALHIASGRTGRFSAFNVCAINDAMFEDALFGHVRGAFTGATGDSPGYLLEADRGTLFLDEIGGLPVLPQMKLLRAIDTRTFRAVGARVDRHSDFRVVSTTNEAVAELLAGSRARGSLRAGGRRRHPCAFPARPGGGHPGPGGAFPLGAPRRSRKTVSTDECRGERARGV